MRIVAVASEIFVAVFILVATLSVWFLLGFDFAIKMKLVVWPTMVACVGIGVLVYDAIVGLKEIIRDYQ